MAYVDRSFSISDEDIMMDAPYVVQNKPPIKEIGLAVSMLVFGTLGIVLGIFMAANQVGGDRAHGIFFAALGGVLFIPGFYYTRIAYYAYKGYKGKRAESSSDNVRAPNNEHVEKILSKVEDYGVFRDAEEATCVKSDLKSKVSKNRKRKKKNASNPSSVTCIESSCIEKNTGDNINAITDNDVFFKMESTDGSYNSIVGENICRGKTRLFCDPQAQNVIDVHATCKNDNCAKRKCLFVNSSGKEPMFSEISSSHQVESRQSEKIQKKKHRLCDSKNNQGDVSVSGLQSLHNDMAIEPEGFPLLQKVDHINSRRRKVKEHTEYSNNNPSTPLKHQSDSPISLNIKSKPLENVQERPKFKYYSKRECRKRREEQRHTCENILVDVSKSQLEAVESSQALSDRVTCEVASTSERPGICPHVLSVNNIRNATSKQLTGKEDQSSKVTKVKASIEILREGYGSESEMCVDKGIVSSVSASLNNAVEENFAAFPKLIEKDVKARKQVLKIEKPLAPVRKKLLVLDLNGLLVDILNGPHIRHRPCMMISRKSAFKRPFCDQFLDFCFEAFDIGVWSSRMKHNVDAVVDYVMGGRQKRLLFSWDQSKCTKTRYNTVENNCKPLVLKELIKLWDKNERDLPWEKGEYTPSNTLLIDDSPYKALRNPPHTAIFPLPYRYNNEDDNSLGPGGDIRKYLEGLVLAFDVQDYVKENPFGQPCISEDHPSWEFYGQIIKDVKGIPHAVPN